MSDAHATNAFPITPALHNCVVLSMCFVLVVWVLHVINQTKAILTLKGSAEACHVLRIDAENPSIRAVSSITADHLRQMIRSKLTCHTESSVQSVRVQCHLIPGSVKMLRGAIPGVFELQFKLSIMAPTEVKVYIGMEKSEIVKHFSYPQKLKTQTFDIEENNGKNSKQKKGLKDRKIKIFQTRRRTNSHQRAYSTHGSTHSNGTAFLASSDHDLKSQSDHENVIFSKYEQISGYDPQISRGSYLKQTEPFIVSPISPTNIRLPHSHLQAQGIDLDDDDDEHSLSTALNRNDSNNDNDIITDEKVKTVSVLFSSDDLISCLEVGLSNRHLLVLSLKSKGVCSDNQPKSPFASPSKEHLARNQGDAQMVVGSGEIDEKDGGKQEIIGNGFGMVQTECSMTEITILGSTLIWQQRRPTQTMNELRTISISLSRKESDPPIIDINNSPANLMRSPSVSLSSSLRRQSISSLQRLETLARFLSFLKVAKQYVFLPSKVVELQDIFGIDEPSELDCSVCLTAPKSVILLPCRHCCVCYTCFQQIDKCPVCRESMISFMRFPSPADTRGHEMVKRRSTANSLSLQYALAPLTQQPN